MPKLFLLLLALLPVLGFAQADIQKLNVLFVDTAAHQHQASCPQRIHVITNAKHRIGHLPNAVMSASLLAAAEGVSWQQLLWATNSAEARQRAAAWAANVACDHGAKGVAYRYAGQTHIRFAADTADYIVVPIAVSSMRRAKVTGKLIADALMRHASPRTLYAAADVDNVLSSLDAADDKRTAALAQFADRLTSVLQQSPSEPAKPTAADMWLCLENAVSAYADSLYLPITDMSNVSVALFDARRRSNGDVLAGMRRYLDDVQLVHPSVLSNNALPTHFVVAASSADEVAMAARSIRDNGHSPRTTYILLLWGNVGGADLKEADRAIFNAIYHLPARVPEAPDLLSQALFAGISLSKPLPLARPFGKRFNPLEQQRTRLAYSPPELAGMSADTLNEIASIAQSMISSEASPSAAVLVARHGRVVYNRTFGNTQYKGGTAVNTGMLYDVASVTKAFGLLPIVMQEFDAHRLTTATKVGDVIDVKRKPKAKITVEQLLLHQSGMPAGIPAFLLCVDSVAAKTPIYSRYRKQGYTRKAGQNLYIHQSVDVQKDVFAPKRSPLHCVEVANSMFATDSFRNRIYRAIFDAQLLKPTYRYSDLNFVILGRMVETLRGTTLDTLFATEVAGPLGARRMLYRPLMRYGASQIVPTANDKLFRHQQLQGTVHDETAALLGGVAGSAGIFSNANELAKVGQMYLNGGIYGGVRLINSSTVATFTSTHAKGNRRGYGFDKPDKRQGYTNPVCDHASLSSYGHSGFSGTLVWVDPEYDLVFVFLSNRICPDAWNNKLIKQGIRSKVHEVAYRAIVK